MITAEALTKNYGVKRAVDSVSFTVQPGKVTGFLGPNGAGKSTTMRMIVGLDRPSTGTVTVNGRKYGEHAAPLREVGALLEAKSVHKSRSARTHLRSLAATHSIPNARVDEVIELTGLSAVATKKVGGFSLGMGQRLGIAVALLGDPQTLILDEPVNGLDPEGVQWVRHLARQQAAQGKTVFISSHLMSEMALTADHLIIIGRGRIIADAPIEQVISGQNLPAARVKTDDADALMNALLGENIQVTRLDAETISVVGLDGRTIAQRALDHNILLHELTPQQQSLEEAYMALTQNDVEYHSSLGQQAFAGTNGKQA